jgi:phospholipid/cholesterol/gamma-HCH transport system permease protein
MIPVTMQIDVRERDHTLVARLAGDWKVREEIPEFERLAEGRADPERIRELRFDTSELGEWDSSLAAFLLDAVRYCDSRGIAVQQDALPDDLVRLLGLARVATEWEIRPASRKEPFLARLGGKGIAAVQGVVGFTTFVGELALGFARVLMGRERFRWRDFWLAIEANSAGAFPIVTLISFLAGFIIAFLGAVVLVEFGAVYYISYLIGFGMLRQMAALMTAVIITGRTGAAFAAELGSMKMMEELDAYKTLGLSPISYLVAPRVLAIVLMMPLLTIYSMFVGILGGLFVAVTVAGLSPAQYFFGLLTPITIVDALLGVFKGLVFGVIIGVSGCMQGMQAGTDAAAVGRAATRAVVMGITLIILANAIIDVLASILDI